MSQPLESTPSSSAQSPAADQTALPDLLILAGCLAAMFWGLGGYGLYEPHEGHFAGVGREMLLSGDWVTPSLNGSPYLNKPPLLYWLVGLSNRLFGINEWSSRLPNALAGWLAVCLAWLWGRRLWGALAGRLAAPMAALTVGWFIFTHQLMTDALLTLLSFGALFALWQAVGQPQDLRRWLRFYLVMALAFLAKGPGALFPLLALLGFVLLRRRWQLLRQARLWWGLPLALLPLLAWALLVEHRNPGFLDHAIWNEVYNRVLDRRWPPDFKVSQVSPLQYLLVTGIWCLPWTFLLPWSGRFAVRSAWRGQGEARPQDQGTQEAAKVADGVLLLMLGALLPVLFFLPIPSRLVYYCLPAVLPVALLTAGWWATTHGATVPAGSARAPAALLLVLGLLAFSAGFWVSPLVAGLPDLQQAPATLELIPPMAFLLGGALLAGGALLGTRRPRAAAAGMLILMGVSNALAAKGLTAYEDIRSSKRMVADLARLAKDERAIWISEGSFELGASAGIAYYLGTDARGRARTVKVMVDDPRREQPRFGQLERGYATTRDQLAELWRGDQPVLFVTDMMRRDFRDPAQAAHLPPEAGEAFGQWGFRRVYLNRAARAVQEGAPAAPK